MKKNFASVTKLYFFFLMNYLRENMAKKKNVEKEVRTFFWVDSWLARVTKKKK